MHDNMHGSDMADQNRMILSSLRAYTKTLSTKAAETAAAIALSMKESPTKSSAITSEVAKSIPRWHFPMLNDLERNGLFYTALQKSVRPEDFVLDIGSGTGLLAMMVAKLGARQVVTCETNPLLAELSRQIIDRHGLSDLIEVIPQQSNDLRVGHELKTRADLLVAEIVDCGLIGEGILPTMRHAREHLLAPGARIIPCSARIVGFLVESSRIFNLNHVSNIAGFDLRMFNLAATVGHFPVRTQSWPHRALSDTGKMVSFDMLNDPLTPGEREVALPITADGEAHGLIVWFEMNLFEDLYICNPPNNTGSHWMQAFIGFEKSVPVSAGTTLHLRFLWQDTTLHAVLA